MTTPDAERLIERILAGDQEAWQEFWAAVAPRLEAVVGRSRVLGRLAAIEDHRRNVVLEVMAKLRDGDFARLRAYRTAREENPADRKSVV